MADGIALANVAILGRGVFELERGVHPPLKDTFLPKLAEHFTLAEEINIYYVDGRTENKTIDEEVDSCGCRLLRHIGHRANFLLHLFFEQILEKGVQILVFDWSTLCELHPLENWKMYLQYAQQYLSPPAVVCVPASEMEQVQEAVLLEQMPTLGQEPLPIGLQCLVVTTRYKELRQDLRIHDIDVGQITSLHLHAHLWTRFPDRGRPSLFYEDRTIVKDIKPLSDHCPILPDKAVELTCVFSTAENKTLNHYLNCWKSEWLFDCWTTVLDAEHPLLNNDRQATPGLRFIRKGDAVEVFQKMQGPDETKSQAAGSNRKGPCHFREFCRSGIDCRFFHTNEEKILFAGKSSPYELKKMKACNGCQRPAYMCHFLHEGEQPLCIRCLQSPCSYECNPDYQRGLLNAKRLQDLIERGYVSLKRVK